MDGIANEMLKISSPSLAPLLTPLFGNIIRLGSFPDPWKRAVTAIICKAGKKDYTFPEAYCPIALLRMVGKVFELMIAQGLTQWAKTNHLLADGHLGGRKGSGTEDALFFLDKWIQSKSAKGKVVAAIFLDVKSAYPLAQPLRLIHSLKKLKCPAYLVLLITSFLSNHTMTIWLEDYASPDFAVPIGLPQGSPLSVILYILYNNSLLHSDCSPASDRISIG